MLESDSFDHYRICRAEDGSLLELGRGAAGVTYLADDINLGRRVALKVIECGFVADERRRRRFVREAQASARLKHRNIAAVYHLGNTGEHYFYAMEYVEGETAQALVEKRGPLDPRTALQIALQIAQALGAAARHQLVHRDIKPGNIMLARLTEAGASGFTAKLIDFGLVHAPEDERARYSSGFVGTPHYASPEQVDERAFDVRSDIYSLGCVLWFLLTGHPPFRGPVGSVFSKHLYQEPAWSEIRRFPRRVRTLLTRMLRKDPAGRPATPEKLCREILACLGEADSGGRGSFIGKLASLDGWRSLANHGAVRSAGCVAAGLLALAILDSRTTVPERGAAGHSASAEAALLSPPAEAAEQVARESRSRPPTITNGSADEADKAETGRPSTDVRDDDALPFYEPRAPLNYGFLDETEPESARSTEAALATPARVDPPQPPVAEAPADLTASAANSHTLHSKTHHRTRTRTVQLSPIAALVSVPRELVSFIRRHTR